MDKLVVDWSDVVLKRDAYGQLQDAISDRNYPALYACLRKTTETFDLQESHHLCSLAVRSGCTRKAFQTLLEHCAPLDDIISFGEGYHQIMAGDLWAVGGLVQEAAASCSCEILKYLLDMGYNPNAIGASTCTALEAALYNNAIGAVALLEQREDVDFTITDTILDIWGAMGMVPVRDICMRIVAGRLLGEKQGTFYREIPLLPGLNVLHGACWENWPLVRRLCGETTVTEQQGKQVLDAYMHSGDPLDVSELAPLLDALFTACPGLLRCKYPRYLLALSLLSGEEQELGLLRPWLEKMPGKMVILAGRRLAEREYDIAACLRRWDERMGSRLRPVLLRDHLLPVRAMARADDAMIREILANSVIQGKPRKGKVSRLAMDVLQIASPSLLAELCGEGKLFAQEDMTALLEYCQEDVHLQALQKRNILLAYGKKQVDYEL